MPRLHQSKIDTTWYYTHSLDPTVARTATKTREARMDMVLWHYSQPGTLMVDITVRNPLAERYLHKARRSAGYAIAEAEREKRTRYGASSNVVCACIETFGRLGQGVRDVLNWIDAVHLFEHTDAHTKYARWAADLQSAIGRAVARNVHTAHEGDHTLSPGHTGDQRCTR